MSIESIRSALPEVARDIKLNLQTVFQDGALTEDQKWGVAVACAIATRNPEVREAITEEAESHVSEAVLEDARAAAVIMGMNNVYYRFRHLIGKEAYGQKPARLRMQRIAKVATTKADFELFCLAVSAINGCEMCMRSHEKVVSDAGVSDDAVHDAIRIASTVNAASVAMGIVAGLPVSA